MRMPLRILVAVVALTWWSSTAVAQEYRAGFEAFKAGDYLGALDIWRPLAEAGDVRAQYGLGVLLERGPGDLDVDLAEAAHWYALAAGQGHMAAENNLGLMYAQGRGLDRDPARAAELWQRAATSGHLIAQYNLGLAYYRGKGVKQDSGEALRWFRQAARNGLPDGQFALGQMYRLGIVVATDAAKALAWYQRAADQGHRTAAAHAQRLIEAGQKPASLEPTRRAAIVGGMGMGLGRRSQPGSSTSGDTQGETEGGSGSRAAAADAGDAGTQSDAAAAARPAGTPAAQSSASSGPVAGSGTAAAAAPARADTTPAAGKDAAGAEGPARPNVTKERAVKAPAPRQSDAATPAVGARVWIGSLSSEAGARQHWRDMRERYPQALAGATARYRRVEVEGKGTFYRVLAGPYADTAAARAVCEAMKAKRPSAFCLPVRSKR